MRPNDSLLALLGLAACSINVAAGSEAPRPRGVAPEFAKFYKDTSTFTCIGDSSVQIPFSAVNDDYCDCPDGSDEPGTAACAHLSRLSPSTPSEHSRGAAGDPKASLPGFYCKNKSHRAAFIPFQRVNDGVCDYEICCDGSDEWAQVGGVKCADKCKEIGKEWRKNEEKRQKSLTAAIKKRKELVAEAARLEKELADRIGVLGTEIQAAEVKAKDLEAELEATQKRERGKVVKGQKKGKVNVLAGLAKSRVEELRHALVDVRAQRDQSRDRIAELESILSTFKEEYNPNFNDEGVKRAVRAWEDYAVRDKADLADPGLDQDLDEISKVDGEESGINWTQWENEEDGSGEIDLIYKLAAYLPDSLVTYIEERVISARDFLVENGVLADQKGDGESEPKAVVDARNALKSAESSLDSLRREQTDKSSELETEYGQDSVFRALKGQCVSKDSGEYTYELCWLDKTRQRSRKGGASVTMGNFQRISSISTDADTTSGEIIAVQKVALEYENGQQCWNGPARSTRVILECGEADEILKIMEDEKCVYSMFVTTPAVCEDSNGGASKEKAKDEL